MVDDGVVGAEVAVGVALDADDVAVALDIANVMAPNVEVGATDSIISIRHYNKGQYHNICGSLGFAVAGQLWFSIGAAWCELIIVGAQTLCSVVVQLWFRLQWYGCVWFMHGSYVVQLWCSY